MQFVGVKALEPVLADGIAAEDAPTTTAPSTTTILSSHAAVASCAAERRSYNDYESRVKTSLVARGQLFRLLTRPGYRSGTRKRQREGYRVRVPASDLVVFPGLLCPHVIVCGHWSFNRRCLVMKDSRFESGRLSRRSRRSSSERRSSIGSWVRLGALTAYDVSPRRSGASARARSPRAPSGLHARFLQGPRVLHCRPQASPARSASSAAMA
jgi:hypothetical protein